MLRGDEMQRTQNEPVIERRAVSLITQFIDDARQAKDVKAAFDAACIAIRQVVADCCLTLWMWDVENERICQAHWNFPDNSAPHVSHGPWLRIESNIGNLFTKGSFDDPDVAWIPNQQLESAVACAGSRGLAYLRLATVDKLQLLLTGCVPDSPDEDFRFFKECLKALGHALVQSIEHIRLRNDRDLLLHIGNLAVENKTRHEFFNQVARCVSAEMRSLGCSIFIYDPFRDELVLGGTTGLWNPATNTDLKQELLSLSYKPGEGLTGWIFANRRTVRMYDATDRGEWDRLSLPWRQDPKSAEAPFKDGEARPFLGAPISFSTPGNSDRDFVGVIRLHGRVGHACYLPSDERRLENVSAELARAVRNWDTQIAARDSLRTQEAVQERLHSLQWRDFGVQEALKVIATQAKNLFQGCAASILLVDETATELVVECDIADAPRTQEKKSRISINKDTSLCGAAAVERGGPIMVPNVSVDPRFNDLDGLIRGVKSEACVAIIVGDRLLGVLNVDSDRLGWFNPNDGLKRKLLEQFARTAAIVIHQKLIQATRESLTFHPAALVHLFRNDLSIVSGVVSQLRTNLNHLCETSDRLLGYWDELCRTSVFAQPRLQLVYLNEEIERAVALQGPRLAQKSVEARFDLVPSLSRPPEGIGLRIEADLLNLNLIISNLLANSVDASRDGGEIHFITRHQNDFAELTIRDFGIGIRHADKSKVLRERFTTKPNGRGDGLWLVSRMVELHRGRISWDSEEQKGTYFTVAFPVVKD